MWSILDAHKLYLSQLWMAILQSITVAAWEQCLRKKAGQHLKNNLFWGYLTLKKSYLESFAIKIVSEIAMVTFALFTFWLKCFARKDLNFLGNHFSGTLVGTTLTKSLGKTKNCTYLVGRNKLFAWNSFPSTSNLIGFGGTLHYNYLWCSHSLDE